MIHKIKPDVDIVLDLLKQTLDSFPKSTFIESLLFQYQERGSLSKKQLEGLYQKAGKVQDISPGKMATLEAIILKKPTRYKSDATLRQEAPQKDILLEALLIAILEKYPAHKRVLFIKTKFENNEPVSAAEKAEIERFHKLLIK